jgi:erythromycin esterase
MFVDMTEGTARAAGFRDQAMAANVQWLLDTMAPGTRVMLWAHNGHVGRAPWPNGVEPMGAHLSAALGSDYVALGFVFDRGSFQALDWTEGQGKPGDLREHTVGPAAPGHLGAVFARSGLPLFGLDLRTLAGTPAGRWLAAPRPMRSIGAVFSGEPEMSAPTVLPELFDGVLFVAETSRARPVKRSGGAGSQ